MCVCKHMHTRARHTCALYMEVKRRISLLPLLSSRTKLGFPDRCSMHFLTQPSFQAEEIP